MQKVINIGQIDSAFDLILNTIKNKEIISAYFALHFILRPRKATAFLRISIRSVQNLLENLLPLLNGV